MLFNKIELSEIQLQNRVGLAPMTRVSATQDGRATARMKQYYSKFGSGGFSFLITEGVYPDEKYSQAYFNQPGLATDEHIDSWKTVTEAVHETGTPIFAQLMHAGAQTQGNIYSTDETIAPSPVQPEREKNPAYGGHGEYPVPREATTKDLSAVHNGFIQAAKNAEKAGFDGVEIHAANGYLLNEFLSTEFNHREDKYGGPPENRVRFPKEVTSGINAAVSEEFVVGIRVSQSAVTIRGYEWPEGEEAARVFFNELWDAGVDYIHTTESNAAKATFESGLSLAEAAVKYTPDDSVIIGNGDLGTPDAARSTLSAGVDLLTLGRSAIANPDWPKRVSNGRELSAFDSSKLWNPTAEISDHEIN